MRESWGSEPLTDETVELADGITIPKVSLIRSSSDQYPFDLAVYLAVVDGKPVCQRLDVIQRRDGPPVSSRLLREVNVGTLVNQAFGVTVEMHLLRHHGDRAPGGVIVPSSVAALAEEGRRRMAGRAQRNRMTDAELDMVADVYRANAGVAGPNGHPRPVQAVADVLCVDRDRARKLVEQARKRGRLESANRRSR